MSSAAGGDDCADHDALVHPGVRETCNGLDDDCSRVLDDSFDCVAGADERCGAVPGLSRRCGSDCTWGECVPVADIACGEGAECRLGEVVACETSCGEGTRACTPACVFGPCAPPSERCNGLDDDCDGEIDEGTFGLAGPEVLLPWIGSWSDAMAATATPDGFAFAYGMNSWPGLEPANPVALAWTDASGASLGDPVRLDDPDHESCFHIDTIAAGDVVAAAWSEGRDVAPLGRWVAFADRGGVLARTTIAEPPSRWDLAHLSWTGDSLVVVQGRQMAVVAPDGTVIADGIALPDEIPDRNPGAIGWDDGVVLPGDAALLWLGLDGSVERRVALDIGEITAILVIEDGLVVAARASTALIRLDHDGRELWRTLADPPFFPGRIVRLGDAFLVGADSWTSGDVSGWLVDSVGNTLAAPSPWVTGTGRNWSTIVSNGDEAFLASAGEVSSIAPLGCARP